MQDITDNTPQKTTNSPDTWTCPIGKYKGQTYKSICMQDPNYAKWLVTVIRSQAARTYMLGLL